MANRWMWIAGAILAAFLLGFVPSYVRARSLNSELETARSGQKVCQIQADAGRAFLEAARKNFGLAGTAASRLFDDLAAVRKDFPQSAEQPKLDAMLAKRDDVTAALARGDAGVMQTLQDLYQSALNLHLP